MNFCTGENRPVGGKESRNRNLMLISKQSLESFSKCFQHGKQKDYIYFALKTREAKNFKTICACTENNVLTENAFKQNFHLATQSL
jgi:hypothetical protein